MHPDFVIWNAALEAVGEPFKDESVPESLIVGHVKEDAAVTTSLQGLLDGEVDGTVTPELREDLVDLLS